MYTNTFNTKWSRRPWNPLDIYFLEKHWRFQLKRNVCDLSISKVWYDNSFREWAIQSEGGRAGQIFYRIGYLFNSIYTTGILQFICNMLIYLHGCLAYHMPIAGCLPTNIDIRRTNAYLDKKTIYMYIVLVFNLREQDQI